MCRVSVSLLVLQLSVGALCGDVRQILLNHLMDKKARFPLHDHVSPGFPVLYCYQGVQRFTIEGLQKAWSGLDISVSEFDKLVIVVGNSTENTNKLLLGASNYDAENREFRLIISPYLTQCLGAKSASGGTENITLDVRSRVLLYLPGLLAIGLFLFYTAHTLSRSIALYYGGGVTVGILASVIILLYVFSKFVPKKNVIGLGIFAGGWAIFGTAMYWFLDHLAETVREYWFYLAVYVLVATVVSFAVLYRMGPISNPRTFNLIQWSIQLVALAMMYFSTQMWELSVCVCVLVVLSCALPSRYNPILLPFLLLYTTLYYLLYPIIVFLRCFSFLNPFSWTASHPRMKLLTQEEYEEQGRVETDKALDDLRRHCQELPTKDMFTMMSRLKRSNRFSSFLSGNDHINTEEQVSHDWEQTESDSSEEDDHSEPTERYSQHSSSMDSSHHGSPVRHPPSPSWRRPHPSPRPHSRLPYRTHAAPNFHTIY